MTNEEFVKELKQEIAKFEKDIKHIANRSIYFGTPRRVTLPHDYLSAKNIINIKGLHSFAEKHKELQGKQIEQMIKKNASTFKFLNKFINCMDDIVDEMRVHGYMYGTMVYRNSMARVNDIGNELK